MWYPFYLRQRSFERADRSAWGAQVALSGWFAVVISMAVISSAQTANGFSNQVPNVASPRSAFVGETGGQSPHQTTAENASQPKRGDSGELKEYRYSQLQMAMPMRITVWCDSESKAQSACKLAFGRASELVKVFSDYDPDSEVRRLTKKPVGQATPVSDHLLRVIEFSRKLSTESGGAFDPTASPAIKLWRIARKNRTLPTSPAIKNALARVGFENLKIDSHNKTVTLLSAEVEFDFGGIAKGYIGDQVLQVLRENGIRIARYKAGGDIVLGDPPPNQNGWTVGVGHNKDGTSKTIQVANCGLSTSGHTQQFVELDGQRFSHVIDPRTGIGLTTRKSAFVVAPSGMQSDALATVGTILSDRDFQSLLNLYAGASGWTQ